LLACSADAASLVDQSCSFAVLLLCTCSQQASSEDYQRILQPHLQEAAANGSSDDAATFTDGLSEDNVTMLSMLRKDGLLAGPLLLALQLYLNKAVGSCLDLNSSSGGGSSKAKGKQQGSTALDRAAALSVLTQLAEQQQLELRAFLLQVSSRDGFSSVCCAKGSSKHAATGNSGCCVAAGC
jgi:hypothetical protein